MVSFKSDEDVLVFYSSDSCTSCKYTKTQWIVHFNTVNFKFKKKEWKRLTSSNTDENVALYTACENEINYAKKKSGSFLKS